MIYLWDIYRAHFQTTIAAQVQYRAELLIWLIGRVLGPLVYLVVWSSVARTGGGQVGSYSPGEFAAYYSVLMVVNHITFSWIMYEYEFRIRNGELSPRLLRPVHLIHSDIADNIGYKILTLPIVVSAAIVISLIFHGTYTLQAWNVAAFVVAALLAFVMRFLFEWALALAAFWTTRLNAINQTYFVTMLFLSGSIAPLSLLPGWLQTLANLLPFQWMASFPVQVFLGRLTPLETLTGFGMLSLWLVISLVIMQLVWRQALKQYSAVGS